MPTFATTARTRPSDRRAGLRVTAARTTIAEDPGEQELARLALGGVELGAEFGRGIAAEVGERAIARKSVASGPRRGEALSVGAESSVDRDPLAELGN